MHWWPDSGKWSYAKRQHLRQRNLWLECVVNYFACHVNLLHQDGRSLVQPHRNGCLLCNFAPYTGFQSCSCNPSLGTGYQPVINAAAHVIPAHFLMYILVSYASRVDPNPCTEYETQWTKLSDDSMLSTLPLKLLTPYSMSAPVVTMEIKPRPD